MNRGYLLVYLYLMYSSSTFNITQCQFNTSVILFFHPMIPLESQMGSHQYCTFNNPFTIAVPLHNSFAHFINNVNKLRE